MFLNVHANFDLKFNGGWICLLSSLGGNGYLSCIG